MKQQLVSIIVTTKNEEKNIGTCLRSILSQSYPKIELLVVDNFSKDGTIKIAKEFTPKVFSKGPERSTQRNFGAAQAEGKYLLFIDADMKLSKNVVKSCIAVIENAEVGGVIIPEKSYGSTFWAKCKMLEKSFYLNVDWIEAARFYSRELFIKSKGFNKSMISGEDWDLSQRISSKYQVGRVAQEFIYHNEGDLSLLVTMKKKYYYAKKISLYLNKNKKSPNIKNQVSIVGRYVLFFKDYKKLFSSPIIGIGLLFMKFCEFLAGGIGYMVASVK